MNYLFAMHNTDIQIGASYVAASLREYGYITYGVIVKNFEELRNTIFEKDIDVVCLSALSKEYTETKKFIKDIRKIESEFNKKLIIILGGGLVSTEPKIVIENIGADIGVIGQGEITICELADSLKNRFDLRTVNGIIFIDENNETVITPPRKELESLDNLPLPAIDLFDLPPNYQFTVSASRSCPFSCTFCYHPSGKKYIQRSLNSIFSEIDYYVNKYSVRNIVFFDELFASNEKRVLAFCQRMKPYKLMFACQMRVNNITPLILDALYDAGCRLISIGLESADDKILKSMKKHITVAQIEKALDLIYNKGIKIKGSFIFGDIEEDSISIRNTLDWMKAHLKYPIVAVRIMVFPGSELYNIAIKRNIITDKLKYLEEGCPLINLSKVAAAELDSAIVEMQNYDKLRKAKVIDINELNMDGTCQVVYECYGCKKTQLSNKITLHEGHYVECTCGIRSWLKPNSFNLKEYSPKTSSFCYKPYDDLFKKVEIRYKRIAIYGANEITQIFLLTSPTLRSCLTEIIDIDMDSQKIDDNIWGYKVISPNDFNKHGSEALFISESQIKDIIENELITRYGIDIPTI